MPNDTHISYTCPSYWMSAVTTIIKATRLHRLRRNQELFKIQTTKLILSPRALSIMYTHLELHNSGIGIVINSDHDLGTEAKMLDTMV